MSTIQFLGSKPYMLKKVIKRQSIIQAAIETFGKNSFQEANISEIAKRANVAEGTIYQYFKNKEDLYFSIPVEKTDEFCAQLDLHLQGIPGALNKIRKIIWYYLYFLKSNPEYSRILMLDMRLNKGFIKTKTYNSFRKVSKRILEILGEGQKEGTIRKDVSVYLIRQLLLGVLEHVVTRWLLKGQKYDLLEHYNEVGELVIDGISHQKKSQSS
jgi:TetR/AcrR family transcriptional regulator, fatty acid metabolism regulator protein